MEWSDEKLCLQWNDFRNNIASSFGKLRRDKDFTDVTLVCEDGQQVEIHKFVLVSASPFFRKILKGAQQHSHPWIYMRDIKSEVLTAMVDFLYQGETNIYQENLDSFLALAGELQLTGLQEDGRKPPDEKISTVEDAKSLKTEPHQSVATQVMCRSRPNIATTPENEILNISGFSDLSDFNQKLKSMMTFSENFVPGIRKERARICNICGKEDNLTNMKNHIEANHLNGLSIPCKVCGNVFKTRNSLRVHYSLFHKQ